MKRQLMIRNDCGSGAFLMPEKQKARMTIWFLQ